MNDKIFLEDDEEFPEPFEYGKKISPHKSGQQANVNENLRNHSLSSRTFLKEVQAKSKPRNHDKRKQTWKEEKVMKRGRSKDGRKKKKVDDMYSINNVVSMTETKTFGNTAINGSKEKQIIQTPEVKVLELSFYALDPMIEESVIDVV